MAEFIQKNWTSLAEYVGYLEEIKAYLKSRGLIVSDNDIVRFAMRHGAAFARVDIKAPKEPKRRPQEHAPLKTWRALADDLECFEVIKKHLWNQGLKNADSDVTHYALKAGALACRMETKFWKEHRKRMKDEAKIAQA